MGGRQWRGPINTAVAVAAGAGAAQLGLAYGLGIITWPPQADETAWAGNAAWATWVAAASVVLGALIADRSTRLHEPAVSDSNGRPVAAGSDGLWRFVLLASAAAGTLLPVALIAAPARATRHAGGLPPMTAAAAYGLAGLLVGLVVAAAALRSPPIARNLLGTVGFAWLVTVVAVVAGALSQAAPVALAGWPMGVSADDGWFRDMHLPGTALAIGGAVLIGVLAAGRPGRHRLGAAISGAAGPFLIASAYLAAGPSAFGVQTAHLSAYLVAPYVVLAGLAGSVLAVAFQGERGPGRPAGRPAAARPRRAPRTLPTPAVDAAVDADGPAPSSPGSKRALPRMRFSLGKSAAPESTPDTKPTAPSAPGRPGGPLFADGADPDRSLMAGAPSEGQADVESAADADTPKATPPRRPRARRANKSTDDESDAEGADA
ncbi:hypothetical protein [Pilimelia columellifera]|uniref:Uncharacterized protein n=1 Tax=Pilimelia columellifera subsp. columellifera TaxID=706583 RepID=A0ABN3N0C4_9ACTN